MTTFRSKAVDRIAYALVLIGFAGFFVCWGIGWTAEGRVLGKPEFEHPTAERSARIEMKEATFFVEPNYARRYRFADSFSLVFWLIAVGGAGIKERDRIATWWKSERQR
ncbi:MAG: hypothetical protein V4502_09755 [Pseudomonadota bacterium]